VIFSPMLFSSFGIAAADEAPGRTYDTLGYTIRACPMIPARARRGEASS